MTPRVAELLEGLRQRLQRHRAAAAPQQRLNEVEIDCRLADRFRRRLVGHLDESPDDLVWGAFAERLCDLFVADTPRGERRLGVLARNCRGMKAHLSTNASP